VRASSECGVIQLTTDKSRVDAHRFYERLGFEPTHRDEAGDRTMITRASQGFRTQVTATLSVRDWSRAMDFYKTAFDAVELYRVDGGGVGRSP
jgi:hypothetical protein